MNVFDRVAQKLALRWLRRTADTARKEGNPVLKALDGWKGFIFVLGFILSGLYALVSGQDVSALLIEAFKAGGWNDPEGMGRAQVFATVIVPMLWAVWSTVSRGWKAYQQYRAGAKPSELLSTEGYVKQALADGQIRIGEDGPIFKG
jgi:hypothetical protein